MSKFLAIVDPWEKPLAHDDAKFPFLASDIDVQCKLIYNQLSRLKPLFGDIIVVNSGVKSHPVFDGLPNYFGLIDKKNDWDVWLCGFHYGRCIHAKIENAMNEFGWSPNRFNIIENLSFLFPGDTKETMVKNARCRQAILDTKEYYWDFEKRLYEL